MYLVRACTRWMTFNDFPGILVPWKGTRTSSLFIFYKILVCGWLPLIEDYPKIPYKNNLKMNPYNLKDL